MIPAHLNRARPSARAFHRFITLEQKKKNMLATARQAIKPTRDPHELGNDLAEALLTARTRAEVAKLLADLCTPAEIRTLAERWHVARLLDGTDLTYREIHDATGVSTTTIVRVARFLKQESNLGYRMALDRLEDEGDAG